MNTLCSLGHPEFQSIQVAGEQEANTPDQRSLVVDHLIENGLCELSVASLGRKISDWKQQLTDVSKQHQLLLFFSSKEAQSLYARLRAFQETDVFDLALSLSPLFQRGSSSFNELLAAIRHERPVAMARAAEDWPSTVGFFLGSVRRHMQEPPLPIRPSNAAAVRTEGLHIHTVEPCAEALLNLVIHVFDRLPEPFELLWCSDATTAR